MTRPLLCNATFRCFLVLLSSTTNTVALANISPSSSASGIHRPIAIVTGGTRGIGSGISSALADAGYDLLLTYNTDVDTADKFADKLRSECEGITVECVGGDISLPETRDSVFSRFDSVFAGRRLHAMVHNAGQYVGLTSDNSDGLKNKPLVYGDGSLANDDGSTNLDTMRYYHRMYGEAFIDLCERSLPRMKDGPGSIVGLSSPGVTAHYYGPDWSYSMPGSGKCLMEYTMRIYAVKAAERLINANVIVPGVTRADSWKHLAKARGLDDEKKMLEGIVDRIVPQKRSMAPRDIGNAVVFLCSDAGRFVTGTVMPVDGGVHLLR